MPSANWRHRLDLQPPGHGADSTLRGEVIEPNTELRPEGVRTMLFDDVINDYACGERLIVYRAGLNATFPLTSLEAAREYMTNVSIPARPACPPYTDGDGMNIY